MNEVHIRTLRKIQIKPPRFSHSNVYIKIENLLGHQYSESYRGFFADGEGKYTSSISMIYNFLAVG